MNDTPNVEALTALLSDYVMGEGHGTDLDNIHLATFLASRGVLVPGTMSERDVDDVLRRPHLPDREPYDPKCDWYDYGPEAFREDLERIARGLGT